MDSHVIVNSTARRDACHYTTRLHAVTYHCINKLSYSHSMENREDIPRVSVDSAQDWRQIRSNYEKAVLSKLEEQVMLRGIMTEKEAIQLHLQQVCIGTLHEKNIDLFL